MKNRTGLSLLVGLLVILLTLTACTSEITVTNTTSITQTVTQTVTITTTLPPTPSGCEQELESVKSQLKEVQDELTSYKLIEQNWGYWEKVRALLQNTLTGVSQIRGLSPPEQVGLRVVTVDWARKTWGEDYVRYNSKKIEIDEMIFKALFILPETTSLAELYAYWPRAYLLAALADKVYFVLENFGKVSAQEAQEALAHEAVHFIQGKHFKNPELATYDENKAWSALIEGDAGFSQKKYKEANPEPPPDIGKLIVTSPPTPPEPERPQTLTKLLYFPYDYGESFVTRLYQQGGWQKVNETYLKLPVSTEQVLHPEKYLTMEGPISIEDLPLNCTELQEKKTDRFGEYFIRIMLENWLQQSEADNAAQGWGNDRLTYYEQQDTYLLTWQTIWDSDRDANEFYQAFLKMLDKADAKEVGANLWLGRGRYFWISKPNNQKVTIVISKEKSMVDAVSNVLLSGR